jgi:hypothetical protein
MPLTLLAALLLAPPQQDPPVTTGSDRGSAVRLQVTGHLDLHYMYRSAAIDQLGSLLNGIAPAPADSQNFWAGRMSLRTDIEVKDFVTGVLELENRSFEQGINKPFGAVPPDSPVQIKQGYIEVGQFLLSGLNVRIGVQNVVFKNRPQDEAFFMDLSESEGFFKGFNAAFNGLTAGYAQCVRLAIRVSVVVLVVFGGLLYATYYGLKTVPTGFIPSQDKGYLLVNMQLPDAASLDRTRLPQVAAGRAERLVGRAFRGSDTVIIGDTPRDIGCARAFGATAIAVATGWHSADDLASHRPDHVFVDLSDQASALAAMLGR